MHSGAGRVAQGLDSAHGMASPTPPSAFAGLTRATLERRSLLIPRSSAVPLSVWGDQGLSCTVLTQNFRLCRGEKTTEPPVRLLCLLSLFRLCLSFALQVFARASTLHSGNMPQRQSPLTPDELPAEWEWDSQWLFNKFSKEKANADKLLLSDGARQRAQITERVARQRWNQVDEELKQALLFLRLTAEQDPSTDADQLVSVRDKCARIQTRRLRELGYEHSLGVPPHAHGRILLSPGRYRMHAIYYGGY
ncbi:hypothetical protein DMC30DRAFT_427613 [Rhodotorula diobovata]|uniref:Uncharacterized protein n=1 Tax=Rhodotorula diobovata TaxID=5288 RepID=A0A5C5G3U8_9BASI|nr:hypothetical protein DMC30DRAFT_427613 [Rhodotorula diobovata]